MKRQVIALVVGAGLLGLAIPVALLGRSALSAPNESGSTFDRAANWIVGTASSEPFFRVARAYRKAYAASAGSADSGAPVRLAALARGIRSPRERSQAHVMVGAVFSLPAGNGSMSFARMRLIGGSRLIAQAVEELRRAVVLDDDNEAAKYDLELVLSSQTPEFAALSKRRLSAPNRPNAKSRHQGQDSRHGRTRKRLRQGGSFGQGSGL